MMTERDLEYAEKCADKLVDIGHDVSWGAQMIRALLDEIKELKENNNSTQISAEMKAKDDTIKQLTKDLEFNREQKMADHRCIEQWRVEYAELEKENKQLNEDIRYSQLQYDVLSNYIKGLREQTGCAELQSLEENIENIMNLANDQMAVNVQLKKENDQLKESLSYRHLRTLYETKCIEQWMAEYNKLEQDNKNLESQLTEYEHQMNLIRGVSGCPVGDYSLKHIAHITELAEKYNGIKEFLKD